MQRNWLIGYRIAEEELRGEDRAEYGANLIKTLSTELTEIYGKGYDRSNLYHCLNFYKNYPKIVDTVYRQSERVLSWSHYRTLLQVDDPAARDWYEKEAISQTWSVRTLQRNISSQYYYRMLKTQNQEAVEQEMLELTADYQNDRLEFIKNPVIAEFLGFSENTDFTEGDVLPAAGEKIIMKSEPNTMKRRHSEKNDNISSFHSEVYLLMKDGVSDMHCMSDAYLAEDLKEEYEQRERQV